MRDGTNTQVCVDGMDVVRDAKGRPLVVYRGSHEPFELSISRDSSEPVPKKGETINWTGSQEVFYFTNKRKIARTYGKHVAAAHLALRNPLIVDGQGQRYGDGVIPAAYVPQAVLNGHDGVIVRNIADVGHGNPIIGDTYIAFSRDQILQLSVEKKMEEKAVLDRIANAAHLKSWDELVTACKGGQTFRINTLDRALHNTLPSAALNLLADASAKEDLVVIWDDSARPSIGKLESFPVEMQQHYREHMEKLERIAASPTETSDEMKARFKNVPAPTMKR